MSASPARVRLLAAGCALALLLPLVLPAGATSQDPPRQNPPVQNPPAGQQPIFRGGTDVVRVDVYPRREGRIVTGLTREDFQVFEDDAPQTIETFEFVPIEVDVQPLDPRDAREARRMAADARNRVFVFYLDTYYVTFEGSARAREPLLAFLRDGLGPRDLYAVMTPRQSPDLLEFGQSTRDAAGYMTLTKPWGEYDAPMTDPVELQIDTCDPNSRFPYPGPLVARWRWAQMFSDLEGLIAHLGVLRPERKNLIVVSERWQWEGRFGGFGRTPAAPRFTAGGSQRARGSFEPPRAVTEHTERCQVLIGSLSGIDFERRRRDLVDQARKANVALYFLSPAPKDLFSALNLSKQMADDTDGLAPVSNDFGAGLQRVVDHQTGYYMIGYRSTHGPEGTRPRAIRVRSTRRGVDLDVQRLYQPPTDEDLARSATRVTAREPTPVERALETLNRLRDETEVFARALAVDNAVDIAVELSLQAWRSRWREGGTVAVLLRDEAGAEVGRTELTLPAGTRSTQVRVPLLAAGTVAQANVRLSRGAETTSEMVSVERRGAGLGTAIVFRAGSLPRLPYVPAADLRFDRVERLRVEWPIAGAVSDPAVRILNARGEERPMDIAVTTVDEAGRRLRADLRLLSLAAGDYVIEAIARFDGQDVKQLLAIRIVR